MFGKRPSQDPQAELKQAQSIQNLEQGRLPVSAIERLQNQFKLQNTPQHIFTSDLSSNEFLLARHAGYEPLGQVMGSCIFHVGYQWTNYGGYGWTGLGQELDTITRARYTARHLAVNRIQQEASLLGATGIIGVRLEQKVYDWGADLIEFMMVGTAIREIDAPVKSNLPFVSDLSGEDFWALHQAGYHPVGFAMGNCTYMQMATWRTQSAMTGGIYGASWMNQELTDYTQALYTTRSLAMSRMDAEAHSVGATGVVGVQLDMDVMEGEYDNQGTTQEYMLFNYSAVGTAIAPYEAIHKPIQPGLTVTLFDKPKGVLL